MSAQTNRAWRAVRRVHERTLCDKYHDDIRVTHLVNRLHGQIERGEVVDGVSLQSSQKEIEGVLWNKAHALADELRSATRQETSR